MRDNVCMVISGDRALAVADVQTLASPDGVVGFFALLGYDTSARLIQTPSALAISADAARKIRRIERIADQEAGALQVYLVELDSVTVQARQALARALRDRTPNFLLVITDDYERLDFVLLEREVPLANSIAFAQPRVTIRPRVLTIERRKPSRVAMRALRRFSYTEADADAQFDKLRSAYGVAEWSEPHFNNRALFSDYYLNVRLPESPAWAEDPKPAYQSFAHLYMRVRERVAGESDAVIRSTLVEPVFRVLGFTWVRGEGGDAPDYALSSNPHAPAVAGCLVYPWDRYLDGKDDKRDAKRGNENPGARVVSVLDSETAAWNIVTNGKLWRLYYAEAHSRATNYYEIDLEETLALTDIEDRATAFRYFWLIFRAAAFVPRTVQVTGEQRSLSFLDELIYESTTYAKRLGERLKDRIFDEVFPQIAAGFIAHIKHHDGLTTDPSQERLDEVFRGTLTLLYRLLFLLYAEARGLLPTREVRGYWEKSVTRLKADVAEAAGTIQDEVSQKLGLAYKAQPTAIALYERLLDLAGALDRGDPALNMPRYDGGLFLTDPDPADRTPEPDAARFLARYKVPDRFFALALDRLARDVDDKTEALVPIDYKSLGVRQLGSIYEGLLEFKLRVAPEKMAIVKGKKTEEVVTYKEAIKDGRIILTHGRGRNAPQRTLPHGAVYLENDRRERKASGSYYTPDHIVEYIVQHAVGPLLADHLESLRGRLRDFERAYHRKEKNNNALVKMGMVPDPVDKLGSQPSWRQVSDDLFAFRVLDPAMGSGHFLVEAVDFITDQAVKFVHQFPRNPIEARLRQTRESIITEMERQRVTIDVTKLTDVNLLKRHVLKRCVYGVDLNPMAVELAKVSLWLDCFTLGAPLSFLDHHLKWGNSLIGTTVQSVEAELSAQTKGHVGDLFGGPFQGLLTATTLIEELASLPDSTAEQSERSHGLFAQFESEQAPYKSMLDLWVSRQFGNKRAQEYLTLMGANHVEYVRSGGKTHTVAPEYHQAIEAAAQLKAEKHFFHWDLEFPEAFVDLSARRWKPIAQQGFDAVVGNPPYVNAIELNQSLGTYEKPFWAKAFESARGTYDLYILFIEKALSLSRSGARIGTITPNKFLSAPYGKALREHVYRNARLVRLLDLSHEAVFDDPSVYPVVSIAVHGITEDQPLVLVDKTTQRGSHSTVEHDYDELTALPDYIWGLLLSSGSELLKKLMRSTEKLESLCIVNASSTAAESDAFSSLITEESNRRTESWRIINTGTIDPFNIKWTDALFTHAGQRLVRPWLTYKEGIVSDSRRHQYSSSKIIFAKVATRIEAVFDEDGKYASVNTNFAFVSGTEGFYYLGLLNSKLMTWIYTQYFGALRMGGGYLQFQAPQLRVLPCRRYDPSDERMAEIAALARDITGGRLRVGPGEAAIDRIVIQLFELDETEVALVNTNSSEEVEHVVA